MHTCIIAPTPDLVRFVGYDQRYHLALAHIHFDSYLKFYFRRSQRGDFVILDNGAKELGRGLDMDTLLNRAGLIEASELVLPDVRFSSEKTLESTEAALRRLERYSYEDTLLGSVSRRLRYMIVPQGGSPSAWRICLERLLESCDRHGLARERVTVGVGYHYDHLFDDGYADLFLSVPLDLHIHALGLPRRLESVHDVLDTRREVRSIDSSRPVVYGGYKLPMWSPLTGEQTRYPGRWDDYFNTPVGLGRDQQVLDNIAKFRWLAQDSWSMRKCVQCESETLYVKAQTSRITCARGHDLGPW